MAKNNVRRPLLGQRQGQSLVESLILAGALAALLGTLGGVVYFGFVHMGMNYLLHEYLICQATVGESECRRQFEKASAPLLFAAKILRFESSGFARTKKVRILLQMPLKRTLTLSKEMRI